MNKNPRKNADWEFVYGLWKPNRLTLVQIIDEYQTTFQRSDTHKRTITESAIRVTAKRRGWVRDIADKVNQETKEILVRSDVRLGKNRTHLNDQEIIRRAAEQGALVIQRHRVSIEKAAEIEQKLLAKLSDEVGRETAEGDQPPAMTLREQASILETLIRVMEKRINLERTAWGLGAGEEKTDDFPETLKKVHEMIKSGDGVWKMASPNAQI
jgi:hypothetical protein